MILRIAQPEEIPELTWISKAAFDTDGLVVNTEPGGPPDYDSISWYRHMMQSGNLYSAICEGKLVGGAVLFPNAEQKKLYIGRIFVDPAHFRNGYGVAMMVQIEKMFPEYLCELDTPVWNVRTNRFYTKLGYQEVGRYEETVYYQKELTYETQ